MPTKNVNMTEHRSEFVDRLVASGRYKDASEVFCEGLRLLEQRAEEDKQRLAQLRRLAAEGFDQIDQGDGMELPDRRRLAMRVGKFGCQAVTGVPWRPSG